MWYIYILKSIKDKRTYTGSTNDLQRRLLEHNSGKVAATKYRKPLKIIYTEEFTDEQKARLKEQYYKCCSGRKKLKLILKNLL